MFRKICDNYIAFEYYSIAFISHMFPGNILLDHTNLFFPNNYQMNDAIQIFISVINVLREYHEMKEDNQKLSKCSEIYYIKTTETY